MVSGLGRYMADRVPWLSGPSKPLGRSEEKVPDFLQPVFPSLPITQYAQDKVHQYAALVETVFGRPLEVYGFLLAKKTPQGLERVVSDAYLAKGQLATGGSVDITSESVLEAGKDIYEKGMGVIGWGHSHGSMPTFASGTDLDNNHVVLDQIFPSTMLFLPAQGPITVEIKYRPPIVPGTVPYVILGGIDPSLAEALENAEATLHPTIQVSFSYNLVVNASGLQTHNTVSLCEYSQGLGVNVVKTYALPIEILAEGEGAQQVNAKEIIRELEERVATDGWRARVRGRPSSYAGQRETPLLWYGSGNHPDNAGIHTGYTKRTNRRPTRPAITYYLHGIETFLGLVAETVLSDVLKDAEWLLDAIERRLDGLY